MIKQCPSHLASYPIMRCQLSPNHKELHRAVDPTTGSIFLWPDRLGIVKVKHERR